MNNTVKILIVVVLIVAVWAVIAIKRKNINPNPEPPASANRTPENETKTEVSSSLPKLVDLGAGKCIPCKMMAPILEELSAEYKGKLQVVVIDVWKNPNEGQKYNLRVIPTQIFFDADGKELFRHEGFFSKEDILAKWKKFGVNLEKGTNNEKN